MKQEREINMAKSELNNKDVCTPENFLLALTLVQYNRLNSAPCDDNGIFLSRSFFSNLGVKILFCTDCDYKRIDDIYDKYEYVDKWTLKFAVVGVTVDRQSNEVAEFDDAIFDYYGPTDINLEVDYYEPYGSVQARYLNHRNTRTHGLFLNKDPELKEYLLDVLAVEKYKYYRMHSGAYWRDNAKCQEAIRVARERQKNNSKVWK